MFDREHKIYLDGIWFDSFYGADYYDDKRIFFAHGAKQFFTIYQILRNGDFTLTIVEEFSGGKFEFDNPADFKRWVGENYNSFIKYLDEVYWDGHLESKLK